MINEEMFKNLSDKDKKEVLSLMSFMKKFKEQERKKELYATYEEYLDLIHINEHLSNENELLQSQLDIANKKLDKINIQKELLKTRLNNTLLVTKDYLYKIDFADAVLSIIGGE